MYTLQNSVGHRAGIFIFWIFVWFLRDWKYQKSSRNVCFNGLWVDISCFQSLFTGYSTYISISIYTYTLIHINTYIYVYIYYIHILYNKNISIHSIHSIHENEKASKTNEKQRENAFLANSDVSSLHRGIHRSTSHTIGRKRRKNVCFSGLLADVDLCRVCRDVYPAKFGRAKGLDFCF